MRRLALEAQQEPGLEEEGEQATGAERDGGGEPGAEAEVVCQLGRRQRPDAGAELVGRGDGGEEERGSATRAEDSHGCILASCDRRESSAVSDQKRVDIGRIIRERTLVDRAINQAIQDTLRQHKLLGQPVVGWKDGKVVWIPAAEIELEQDSAPEHDLKG